MTTLGNIAGIPRTFKCSDDGPSNSRNLVVCIDGTSNQFCTRNTNIVEFHRHIAKNDRQLTYYSSGLGTASEVDGPSLRHRLSNDLDMAIGRNIQKIIMASYRWLSNNYQDGDRIFLFGYSRGAYQARALAGMISRVGLLLPGNDDQIPLAFKLYSKSGDDLSLTSTTASIFSLPVTKQSKKNAKYSELAETFPKAFCRVNVHIHFVGAWDTVSSVGLSRGKMLPCTTSSCEHVCYFRHALALDERRVKFLPEYVYGGRTSGSDDGRIKEVWFAGSHSDVGGGNGRNTTLQSGNAPLLWMRSQAIAAGLMMEPVQVMWKISDLNKQITHSLNLGWWPLELLPLKRLLYYNSDGQTNWPHFGEPRRILPGQKVHVSALFKDHYKPYAQFYNDSQTWPEPMCWLDEQRHHNLSDLWEDDIFDRTSVEALLNGLQQGPPNVDALDHLAFMVSFEVCKLAIRDYKNARQILATFLNSKNRVIRLSTAVTYCELGWAQDWCLGTIQAELGRQITEDFSDLLKNGKQCPRACVYLPSLCKCTGLKARLISDENLKTLVQLLDNTRIVKHEQGTSTAAFHSAQALSILMKSDDEVTQRLIDIEAVTDITEALRSNHGPVLASVLSVLNGLAKHQCGRDVMKSGPTIITLLKLVKHSDDFVAWAAIRVLCSLLREDDLREMMLQFGVLSTLLDLLDRCSMETKQVACQALVVFTKHEDVQRELSQGSYLQTLAKQVQSHVPSKRGGAISALVELSKTEVRTAVTEAIKAAKTVHALVTQLNQESTALSAASVLARLVKIDDVAIMVSDEESGACLGIVAMLRRRWFDRVRGEDGLQILSELFKCDRLQSAVLKVAIGELCEMINNPGHYESIYAGLHYLHIIARFDEGGRTPLLSEMLSLVPHVVNALRVPHRKVQRIAIEALRYLSAEDAIYSEISIEDMRSRILECVLDLLEDRHAHVVFAASTVLSFLAVDKSLCDRVVSEERFQNLSDEYYNGLELEYDDNGRGPREDEVSDSVRRMIKAVQDASGDMSTTN